MLIFTLIFCFILWLVMQKFNGVFGKVAGTGIGIGMLAFIIVLPILALMIVILPFIMGALIPVVLFLGLCTAVIWTVRTVCKPKTVVIIEP